jgi:hypothetical protein
VAIVADSRVSRPGTARRPAPTPVWVAEASI